MSRYFQAPSGLLAMRTYGQPGRRSIVLLHSLGSSSLAFESVSHALSSRYAIYAVDAWGHGDTPPRGGKFSLDGVAADVIAFITSLTAPVICVGVSMGGILAQMLAARSPHLISKLVLSNTFRYLPNGPDRINELMNQHSQDSAEPWLRTRAARTLAATAPPESLELYLAAANTVDQKSYIGAAKSVYGVDIRKLSPAIRCPTLVITGEHEQRIPTEVTNDLAQSIRGARLLCLPRAGHLPHLDVPAAFAAVIDAIAVGRQIAPCETDYV